MMHTRYPYEWRRIMKLGKAGPIIDMLMDYGNISPKQGAPAPWVSGFGFRVSGFGFRVSGFGFRHALGSRHPRAWLNPEPLASRPSKVCP